MAEKTWDGRGDRLSDMRMSMLSGRAADDLRLSGLHLRLLAHFGRQNNRRGWLRVSQSELAEQWSVSRQRVNMAIRDLVGWGYVLKRDQSRTGESFCTYKTRLDEPDDVDEGVSPVRDTPDDGGVSPVGDTGSVASTRHQCHLQDDTSVTLMDTKKTDTSPGNADTHSLTHHLEPVCASGGKPVEKPDPIIAELLADETAEHVVEQFVRPLWGAKKLPAGVEPLAFLRDIRAALAPCEPEVLDRAVILVRRERTVWPSAAQAFEICRRAALDVPLKNFPVDSPPGRAWIAHYRATNRAFWAKTCEERGYVAERSAVPPIAKGRAA